MVAKVLQVLFTYGSPSKVRMRFVVTYVTLIVIGLSYHSTKLRLVWDPGSAIMSLLQSLIPILWSLIIEKSEPSYTYLVLIVVLLISHPRSVAPGDIGRHWSDNLR